ncbi:MAG: alkaline phosphatase family protein, partial [Gemmatimonadales bacterium]
ALRNVRRDVSCTGHGVRRAKGWCVLHNGWTRRSAMAAAMSAAALAVTAWTGVGPASGADDAAASIPHYQHVVVVMMENTSYGSIIGNPEAPDINALAHRYGLATDYFGVTHPSEPNYMAAVGGDYFGVQDDNAFYCTPALASSDPECSGTTVDHTVDASSIADQLTAAGMTWKGYFQGLPPTPPAGQLVTSGDDANGPYTYKYPTHADALYASKHNPFLNFAGTQGDVAAMVPDSQLQSDLAAGTLPNFSLVVPDQCHDMHGTGSCTDTNALIAAGDAYVGATVDAVTSSKTWTEGRNAIVVTWDEDDFSDSGQPGTGCCGADPGGGRVATVVITNRGRYPVADGTPYDHYSLLRSLEAAFGLPLLAHAGDASVPPMTPLFHP